MSGPGSAQCPGDASDFHVPVYLLDTDLPENSPWDRTLSDSLYGGDQHYRICQEAVLGIGGIKLLRSVGVKNINSYHMNEGHAAFLTVALLEEQMRLRKYPFRWKRILKSYGESVFSPRTRPLRRGTTRLSWDSVRQIFAKKTAAPCCASPGFWG